MTEKRWKWEANHPAIRMYKILAVCLVLMIALQSQTVWASEEDRKDVELIFEGAIGTEISVFSSPDGKGKEICVDEDRLTLHNVRVGDVFSYKTMASGCYFVTTSFVITEEDLSAQTKRIAVTRQNRSEQGYEATEVQCWSKEVEESLFSKDTLTNVDLTLLDTPAFHTSKADNAFTTINEGVEYLKKIDASSGEGHLFFLDSQRKWPVMIFTKANLSAADSLDSALKVLSKDGKMKVMYQAQIHGNEPAAGEGALTVASTLSQGGADYLESADVIMIPYVNLYGARNFVRASDGYGTNLNRDSLALRSDATKKLHWLYGRLMPEIFIDGHEFAGTSNAVGENENGYFFKWLDDIQVTCVNNLNREQGIFNDETTIVTNTLTELRDKGFRTFMYQPSCNNTTSCNYARLRNSYTFLIESNGIGLGKNHFERRVLSQHEAVLSILQQVCQSSRTIQQNVGNARKGLINRGKTYSASDRFVLKHGYSSNSGISVPRPSFDFMGNFVGSPDKMETCPNAVGVLRSRTRPTAYIIPKGAAGAQTAKSTLAANGARYFEVGKNTMIPVRRYTGSENYATPGKKNRTMFTEGAYVFFMDQEAANIISASMEPDVNDTIGFKGSFAQSHVFKPLSRGGFSIYRYESANPQTNLKLKIDQQPADVRVKHQAYAKFSVRASGKNPTYRWYYKKSKRNDWKRCKESTASKSTLMVKHLKEKRGYRYRCVISNGNIQVISKDVYLK